MSLTAAAATGPGGRAAEPAGAVHQATLERAFGRIFAVFVALIVVVFWFSSATLSGQRPGSVAADVLLSVLLIWQALRALRRPPSQRDLYLLAAATGALLLASRTLAVPGSPFLVDDAYVLVSAGGRRLGGVVSAGSWCRSPSCWSSWPPEPGIRAGTCRSSRRSPRSPPWRARPGLPG